MTKQYANKGVKRNKKPLQNILYKVEVVQIKEDHYDPERHPKFKFKEEGYLSLLWDYEKEHNKYPNYWKFHGLITPEDLKTLIGEKQWGKFCQGKREFITQRRIDGKNI